MLEALDEEVSDAVVENQELDAEGSGDVVHSVGNKKMEYVECRGRKDS